MAAQTNAAPASGSQPDQKASAGKGGEASPNPMELDFETVLAEELGELNEDPEDADSDAADAEGEDDSDTDADIADDDEGSEEDAEEDEDEESEEDPEESEEEEDEPEGKGLEKLPAGLRKRVKKLFARDKSQKEEIASLKSQLDEIQGEPTPLNASRRSPLSDVRNKSQLEERLQFARDTRSWCRKNREGGSRTEGGKEVELDAEDVQARLEWAESVIEDAPNREKYLAEYEGAHAYAKEHFPEMFRKGTSEYQVAEEALRVVPELVKFPHYEAFIGHYTTGLKIAIDRKNGVKWVRIDPSAKDGKANGKQPNAAAPKKAAPKISQPVKRGAPPMRPTNGKRPVDFAALEARVVSGDDDALEALVAAELA